MVDLDVLVDLLCPTVRLAQGIVIVIAQRGINGLKSPRDVYITAGIAAHIENGGAVQQVGDPQSTTIVLG